MDGLILYCYLYFDLDLLNLRYCLVKFECLLILNKIRVLYFNCFFFSFKVV